MFKHYYTLLDRYDRLLFLLIVFHTVGNGVWLLLNSMPPGWDQSVHIVLSVKFFEYLANSFSHFNFVEFLRLSNYYPPFVHLAGSALAYAGGFDYRIIALTGTIFFAFAILFLYFYTFELTGDRKVSFFAAFFFSFFISVFAESRRHMLDIPLTALFITGLYLLKKSLNFSGKKSTLAFFLVAALAVLTKWYAAVYFFLPVLIEIIFVIRHKIDKKTVMNVGLGMAIFLVLVFPWYLVNLPKIANTTARLIPANSTEIRSIFNIDNFLLHLKLMIMFETSFLGFIIFLIGLAAVAIKKIYRPILFIIFIIAFNYIFFSVIQNPNIRYLIPLMPFVAIVMAVGFKDILGLGRRLSSVVILAVIAVFILSYLILSFGLPVFPRYKHAFNFPLIGWTDVYYLHYTPVRVIYDKRNFDYEGVLRDLMSLKSGRIAVLLLKDTELANMGIFDPYLYKNLKSRKNDVFFVGYPLLKGRLTDPEMTDVLSKNVDFALVPKDDVGDPNVIGGYEEILRFQNFFLRGGVSNFVLIKEYELPSEPYYPGDTLLLYKNISGKL